jgi:hypothetical protein
MAANTALNTILRDAAKWPLLRMTAVRADDDGGVWLTAVRAAR